MYREKRRTQSLPFSHPPLLERPPLGPFPGTCFCSPGCVDMAPAGPSFSWGIKRGRGGGGTHNKTQAGGGPFLLKFDGKREG